MPSFSYRPPNSPRCYNCWSPAHVGFHCPKPDLPFHERENMRIQYGLPVLNKGNNLVLNPCFNCWKSTDHTFLKCPEPRRSTVGREIVRWKRMVPMTVTWRQVLVRSGVKPLPMKADNVAKSTINEMEKRWNVEQSKKSSNAWRRNDNWRVQVDKAVSEELPQPNTSLQFPENELEEYLRIQNLGSKSFTQQVHGRMFSPANKGRGELLMIRSSRPGTTFHGGGNNNSSFDAQEFQQTLLNKAVLEPPPLIDFSDDAEGESSREVFPDLENLSFEKSLSESTTPESLSENSVMHYGNEKATMVEYNSTTIDLCDESDGAEETAQGDNIDDEIISISSDDVSHQKPAPNRKVGGRGVCGTRPRRKQGHSIKYI